MRLDELQAEMSSLFGGSNLPLAVTDDEMQVMWANPFASKRFPDLKFPDGLLHLAGWKEWGDVLDQLRRGEMKIIRRKARILDFSRIVLLPVMEDTLVGCLAIFVTDCASASEDEPDDRIPALESFSNAYRMPLTIIFSTLGLMLRSTECSATMKAYIKLITQNGYRLYRTLNNLTEITRLTGGGVELQLQNGDLTDYVNNLCRAAGILTASVGIPLSCDVPQKKILTAFDPGRLSSAFFNIISNSCKYTREGNHIRVRLVESNGVAHVTVADSGAGIPAEALEHVFEPYFARDPEGRVFGGSGLGLAIVRYIIQLHGGTIAVQSREGEGTTVAFTLPISPIENAPDYIAENSVDYLSDRFSALYIEMADVCGSPMP